MTKSMRIENNEWSLGKDFSGEAIPLALTTLTTKKWEEGKAFPIVGYDMNSHETFHLYIKLLDTSFWT